MVIIFVWRVLTLEHVVTQSVCLPYFARDEALLTHNFGWLVHSLSIKTWWKYMILLGGTDVKEAVNLQSTWLQTIKLNLQFILYQMSYGSKFWHTWQSKIMHSTFCNSFSWVHFHTSWNNNARLLFCTTSLEETSKQMSNIVWRTLKGLDLRPYWRLSKLTESSLISILRKCSNIEILQLPGDPVFLFHNFHLNWFFPISTS
jgi:hypothetical protein